MSNMDYTKKIFRFDDVCSNIDVEEHERIVLAIREVFPDCTILFGVSPLTHNNCGERVYPELFNALSDYRHFYSVDSAYLPVLVPGIVYAGHGLVHLDHRLLDFSAQEMSILTSCSLVKSKIFIPPFNKWNEITEQICFENGIELIKFEDGWRSMEHNKYDVKHNLWYLHAREWTEDKIKNWLDGN